MGVAIVSLATCLVFQNARRVVTIEYFDTWDIQESIVKRSVWADQSQSPPLKMMSAFALANDLRGHLEASREEIGYGDWNVLAISLEKLEFVDEEDSWAYIARFEACEFPLPAGVSLALEGYVIILMDGAIVFDGSSYPEKVGNTLLEFPNTTDGQSSMQYPSGE